MKVFKKVLALILTLSMLMTMSVQVFAKSETEYLYDVRIVYAESLEDAKEKLANSEYRDYKLFEYNLNEGTEAHIGALGFGEEPHVYIAYLTTTDVELAITDIAVMDMNGGYSEGSLQAMLEKSMAEYEVYAEQYIKAFHYFAEALEDGSALAEAAYRQLNLYKDPDSGERLGDLLLSDISSEALATILLQGNINILDNMRALLAMGVSYNESGKSYLETVEETAAQMNADKNAFADQNWYEISVKVSGTFGVIREMIHDYNSVKDTLDYTDEEMTEKELEYLESATITAWLEDIEYLDGKSLADFICSYQETEDSHLTVYPLIAAMNDGQKAMTELCQFYNVIRYSATDLAAEAMEEQIVALENDCGELGISIYVGVDRALYSGTFAVTTAADRAAASTGRNVVSDVFSSTNSIATYVVSGVAFLGNIGLLAHNLSVISKAAQSILTPEQIASRAAKAFENYFTTSGNLLVVHGSKATWEAPKQAIELFAKYYNAPYDPTATVMENATAVFDKLNSMRLDPNAMSVKENISISNFKTTNMLSQRTADNARRAAEASNQANQAASSGFSVAGAWAIFGGITLAIAATNIGIWIYNYLNPELTDIPLALVDVKESEEGDRYLYYEVVKDIEDRAADTNAFEGEGWNALYVCRSYEAGTALTANFDISYNTNQAEKNQISIHKFGETAGFDLNSHAFGDEKQIYLTVTDSGDEKEGASAVPDVVGSLITTGIYLLVGGVGIFAGMGIMALVQKSKKKEKEEQA